MRGGKRPGAGRPPGIPTQPIRIPTTLLSEIEHTKGIQRGDVLSLRKALNQVISEGLRQQPHDETLTVSKHLFDAVISKWQDKAQSNKKLRALFYDFKALFEKD